MGRKRSVARFEARKAYDFGGDLPPSKPAVYRGGDHYMTVESDDGAVALADLLNRAVAMNAAAVAGSEAFGRTKIAYAIARAMGGQIDFDTFAMGAKALEPSA